MPVRKRRKKVERVPLTTERILDAAAALIEREGLPALSMRSLGAELNVEAMSLYHHFPSKAHICDALLDRLLDRIPMPSVELPWRERVRSAFVAYRTVILSQPSFASFALTHRMNTRRALAFMERVTVLCFSEGFSPEDAARAFRSLGYYAMGAMLDETAGYSRGPSAAEPVSNEEQAAIAPHLLAMAPYFAPEHWERTFLFGLELLIDEIDEQRQARPHETR